MRIGLVGTGKIACEALAVFSTMPDVVRVVSVFARPHSRGKAEVLAAEHGIGEVYGDYDQMLAHTKVDYIYICLVNSAHYDYAARALQAGFNVIVEKPMCPAVAQVESLAAMARERGLLLVEAMTLLHEPNFKAISSAVARLGRIRTVECNYSQRSSRYDRFLRHDVAPAFDPALCGGALLDLNVYNLTFVVALFGMPVSHSYLASRGYNGIDTSGIMTLRYEHFDAKCSAAKDRDGDNFGYIEGENGYLRVKGSVSELREAEITIDGHTEVVGTPLEGHRMEAEFREFDRMLRCADRAAVDRLLAITRQVATLFDPSAS